jgi:hypothetical protein
MDIPQLISNAFAAAVEGDTDRAADALDEIGFNTNSAQMYGVCCAFAAAGTRAVQLLGPAFDPTSGDMLALEEVEPGAAERNPQQAWAMRFFVAFANGDIPMTNALYSTARKAGAQNFCESVASLLLVVAELGRTAVEEVARKS